ncbi:MAG: hypothetical protein EPO11_00100 [Gammaproteobacteria bacterium]|nr:MAG: hypothetical protein EPO11_00100 [Gammaproteobacteria bacterium]
MPYITREDGEHFVIPSYRDVMSTKQKSMLKKEVLALSQNYGDYITLQRKGSQYEVAFSPDTGYLLGESIWHNFKRPMDMIYCEAIPNTTEAILVIVKSGSVYLDGSFPLESIPEELIIFLTQQNNFEIYIYGNVPISQTPEEGKFNFEPKAVKSFKVLDNPVFPTVPLLKIYQLQLVDTVLKAHGIGVFPTRQIVIGVVVVVVGWWLWSFLTAHEAVQQVILPKEDTYAAYKTALTSPAPGQEIKQFLDRLNLLYTMPGWVPLKINYTTGSLTALVQSAGMKVETLFAWAKNNRATPTIKPDGIYLTLHISALSRPTPENIYSLNEVIGTLVDRLATVYPGNHISLDTFTPQGAITEVKVTIKLDNVSSIVLALIGEQLQDLPLTLQSMDIKLTNGIISGSLILNALGS